MRRLALAVAVLSVLLAPVGSAFWAAHGGWEPDYPGDVEEQLMWADPDTELFGEKVYFNAYLSNMGAGANPNNAVTQGRVLPSEFFANAYLGLWKDCNRDGYVGMAETAVTEYPAEVLLAHELLGDAVVCTEGNGHIHGGWVYEFLWIGSEDNVFDRSGAARFMINDTEARVWADVGLPGRVDYTHGDGACSLNPPQGALSSTGGLLGWLDCNTGYAIVDATNLVDAQTGTAIGFGDVPPCSQSPLNVGVQLFASDPRCGDSGKPGLLGHEEGDERPLVVATTCEPPAVPGTPVDDPTADGKHTVEAENPATGEPVVVTLTDDEGNLATTPAVPSVTTPSADGDGSAYDAAARATANANDCGASPLFHTSPETTIGGVEPAHRNPDLTLQFLAYDHVALPMAFAGLSFLLTNPVLDAFGPVVDIVAPGATDGVPRATTDLVAPLGSTPPNGGLGVPHTLGGGVAFSPAWVTPVGNVPVGGTLVRDDLTPAGATYFTFYASVGAATTGMGATLPPAGDRVYGFEWCEGATSGLVLGFDCDPANWWDTTKGAADENVVAHELWSGRNVGVRAGQPYQLRDTDCYDGSLTSALPGVGLGLAPLSEDGSC